MMKKTKILALIFALALILSSSQVFAFANNSEASANEVTVIFHNEVSPEIQERIIAHFNGEELPVAGSRGITCTLFGHDLEKSSIDTVSHKVRTTVPRCLRETYTYEICSRCDYEEYTLVSSTYIDCCS